MNNSKTGYTVNAAISHSEMQRKCQLLTVCKIAAFVCVAAFCCSSWHVCTWERFDTSYTYWCVCVCDISTQQKIEETRSPAPKTHWPWATTTVAWVLIGGRPRHVVHNTRSHCMSQPLRWLSAIRRNFKLLTFKLDLICQPLTNNW